MSGSATTLEPSAVTQVAQAPALARGRIISIDLLRGLVMVLMALDHARYYFSNVPFSPEDMSSTNLALFLTRWVTHLCAPVFFFLTGVSIYLSAGRNRSRFSVAQLTALRGLWLIILELTVIGFAWTFNPGYSVAGVIWSLGWAMIFVAALTRFPPTVAAVVGAVMIVGHNLLDGVRAADLGAWGWVWNLLHQPWVAPLPWGTNFFVLFPLIPWIGVAALGYGLAPVFSRAPKERQRLFVLWGLGAVAAFLVLRIANLYGNPAVPSIRGAMGTFTVPPDATWDYVLIGVLNVEKYPPSLQFLLMTLGAGALVLAWYQRYDVASRIGPFSRILHVFGLVPFAFYVLHLFLLHSSALLVALATGQPSQWLQWGGTFPSKGPPDYGYALPVVYLMTVVALAVLYPVCKRIAGFKARSRSWWMVFA